MKKKYIGSIVIVLFIVMFVYQFIDSSSIITKEEVRKLEKHMEKEYAILMDGNTTLVDIDTYDKLIKKAQQAMFDVQDEALYVGKFICKLNTCQGNPKDENYHAYIDVTNKLVDTKEMLAQLKEKRSQRKCYEKDMETLKRFKGDQ